MKHKDIAPFAWVNTKEVEGNGIDDDQNGYVDDVFGWNFVDKNNQVIDYKFLGKFSPDVFQFFAVQSKMLNGTVRPEEILWIKEKAQKKEFMAELSTFGNFVHGTHVAGISIKGTKDTKLLAMKIIPTEVKEPENEGSDQGDDAETSELANMVKGKNLAYRIGVLKMVLKQLAQGQMAQMGSIASYLADQKVDVANGSFGTGFDQANKIVTILSMPIFSRMPSETELSTYSKFFMIELLEAGKAAMGQAAGTVFVYAAGNETSDNDLYPESPGNIDAANVISVAATNGRTKLASFSNYGKTKVHVAAPGVNILSSIPGDQYLAISGTSQAAPYVTNVVAEMKQVSPKLVPAELKKVLMETVDVKDFLKGKVVSQGIVNRQRALKAAYYTQMYSVAEAIRMARQEIKEELMDDKDFGVPSRGEHPDAAKFVLPLPSVFSF